MEEYGKHPKRIDLINAVFSMYRFDRPTKKSVLYANFLFSPAIPCFVPPLHFIFFQLGQELMVLAQLLEALIAPQFFKMGF